MQTSLQNSTPVKVRPWYDQYCVPFWIIGFTLMNLAPYLPIPLDDISWRTGVVLFSAALGYLVSISISHSSRPELVDDSQRGSVWIYRAIIVVGTIFAFSKSFGI